jgi:hypothetical protein
MAGTDRLATVMENKTMHEMWLRMSAMYLKMGDQAQSVEFLRQIEEDQKRILNGRLAARPVSAVESKPVVVFHTPPTKKRSRDDETVEVTSSGHKVSRKQRRKLEQHLKEVEEEENASSLQNEENSDDDSEEGYSISCSTITNSDVPSKLCVDAHVRPGLSVVSILSCS